MKYWGSSTQEVTNLGTIMKKWPSIEGPTGNPARELGGRIGPTSLRKVPYHTRKLIFFATIYFPGRGFCPTFNIFLNMRRCMVRYRPSCPPQIQAGSNTMESRVWVAAGHLVQSPDILKGRSRPFIILRSIRATDYFQKVHTSSSMSYILMNDHS